VFSLSFQVGSVAPLVGIAILASVFRLLAVSNTKQPSSKTGCKQALITPLSRKKQAQISLPTSAVLKLVRRLTLANTADPSRPVSS
jgi:hypothetical protein